MSQVFAGAANGSFEFPLPAEHVLLVTAINVVCNSLGANAETLTWWAYNQQQGKPHFELIHYRNNTVVPTNISAQWIGSPICVLSADNSQVFASCNLAAVANFTLNASMAGVLIPKGTIATS